MSVLLLLFKILSKCLGYAKGKKKKKGNETHDRKIGKEEVKLLVLANNMIFYIENSTKSPKCC